MNELLYVRNVASILFSPTSESTLKPYTGFHANVRPKIVVSAAT